MTFKTRLIDIGYGQKWPTDLLLLSLTSDRELGETEWWRRMAILQNAAAQTYDSSLLEALNQAKEKRWGSRFPQQDVTTPQNMPNSGSDEGLNYFAPTRILQAMLYEDWFDKVCADKKKYNPAWREDLIVELMNSEYRDEIARNWKEENQRLQIKGHIIGALMNAGVLNKKALAIAREYYGTDDNTAEVKTLAKYMGDSRRKYYADWIIEHVTQSPSIENG